MKESSPSLGFGVHTLSEFVFCPRAGIIAAAKRSEEEEPGDDPVHLDFLPRYSVPVIEEELALRIRSLGAWGGRFVGLLAAIGVALFLGWKIIVLVSAIVLAWIAWRLNREIRAVLTLTDCLRQARLAKPKEPAEKLATQEPVNWWELLSAGFDSIRPQEIFRDETGGLSGKPWRVLRKGAVRIPVIRIGKEHYEAGRYWIGSQHEVRLTAYAHLLAVCEGGTVPYGVVLFGTSYDGVAVPITSKLRDQFQEQSNGLIRTLHVIRSGVVPLPPDDKRCSGCPHGKPEKVTGTALHPRSTAKVHGRSGRDGALYHSACGDCFGWVPPHDGAKRKGLLPPGN
jgi:hypothetical protein